MGPKHYNSTAKTKLRLVDVTLTFGVMNGLGELSGEDIDLLYDLREALRKAEPPTERFLPAQRADEVFLREVEIELKTSQVQFMLQMLFGKVKAFTAGDLDHVYEVRSRLRKALQGAEKRAEPETAPDDESGPEDADT